MKVTMINPLRWKRKYVVIGLMFLVIISGGWWWFSKNNESSEELGTARVFRGNLEKSISLSGSVRTSNIIGVYTKASGIVSEVYVSDGQEVKAGDQLAEITLDSEGKNNQASAWASYLSAKRGVGSAQASQYSDQASMLQKWDEFMKKTDEENFSDPDSSYRDLPEFHIVEKQWLAAETSYKTQETAITSAQAQMSQSWYNYQLYQSTVTAPIDGSLIGLNLARGLTISPALSSSGNAASQVVATIKVDGPVVLEMNATEIDVFDIKVGQVAVLSFDSIADEKFEGVVVAVDRVGSVSNGVTTYSVLLSLETDNEKILPNMTVTADISLERREGVLVVPSDAVVQGRDGRSFVRVVEGGRVEPVEVKIGLETDEGVEITEGIEEGREIISGQEVSMGDRNSFRPQQGGIMMGGGPGMRVR